MTVAKILSVIRSGFDIGTSKPLSMADYVRQLGDICLPTEAQTRAFAIHVAHDHSWYKHLPYAQPGQSFHFFLGVPSEQHRREFGDIDYATYDDGDPQGVRANPALARLPEEILEAGRVCLTAFVHTNTSGSGLCAWEDRLHKMPFETIRWPEESGGREGWRKILDCVRYLRSQNKLGGDRPPSPTKEEFERLQREHPFIACWRPEMLLYQFTACEQDRQINEMVAAIGRVCRLLEVERNKLGRLGG